MGIDSLSERGNESIWEKGKEEEAHHEGKEMKHGYGVLKLHHHHFYPNQALAPTTPPPATT